MVKMENNVQQINEQKDVLEIVADKDLVRLRDVFKVDWPSHVHIYNFMDSCIRWRKEKDWKDCVTVYCPNGDWKDGTIVAIVELHCYDLIVYSFDKNLTRLQTSLRETKAIKWDKQVIFPSIRLEFLEILRQLKGEITNSCITHVPSYIWWLPKDRSLQYDISIPSELYLAPLSPRHCDVMNAVWPHRHEGSDVYIGKLIEVNGGVGLFAKEGHELRAWVLKSYFGGLGILQVDEKYKRMGYGSLLAKIFSKKLAEEGLDAIGCVVNENFKSQNMFNKLGFEKIFAVTWILSDR